MLAKPTVTKHQARAQERSAKIARNTLYLYIQMLVQLVVSLFTARVVFRTLGEIDYGIFSVVGGVMSVFVVLNSLESATMRFITYEQGKQSEPERLHAVFSTACFVHVSIAAIVFLLAETIGLYYISNYLVIPPERLTATIWVYQFYIATAIIGILCAPYDALIVAHERMGVFASIGIYNVLTNLIVIFLVQWAETDKLILYGALIMLIQISLRIIYGIYCNKNFKETHGNWVFEKPLFIKMLKFGGWSFNGTLASIGYTQGINILLNFFYGPVLNTAYGVANTVQSKIYSFAENFLTAVKPQVVKSYASEDFTYLHSLVTNSSRYSLLLLYFISLPVLLETHYILYVWLGEVPEYTVWFVRLVIMSTMIDTLGRIMCMAIHATGRIAKFQMIEANLLLIIVPLAWWILHEGISPVYVFLVQLIIFTITQVVRMFIVCPAIKLSVWKYTYNVLLRSTMTMLIGSAIPLIVHFNIGLTDYPLAMVIVDSCVCIISSGIAIYYLGCDNNHRKMIAAKAINMINIIRRKQ